MVDAAVAGFESKWIAALPEFGLALRFLDPDARVARSAFACIGFEIEHTASHIDEPEVAVRKLRWWLDELEGMAHGQSGHPLTQALVAHAPIDRVPTACWRRAIAAALSSLDAAPAADLEALLDGHRALYRPLAAVATHLFREGDADTIGEMHALRRVVRDALAGHAGSAERRLRWPLDVLARHRLSRADLAVASPAREAAARDLARTLAGRFDALDRNALPVIDAVTAHAERWRCGKLAASRAPSLRAPAVFMHLPFSAAWQAWRAARRRQPP